MNPIVPVLVTFVAYSLIPLIIAYSTSNPIQAKKYQNYCFGGNLVVFVIFAIINSSNSGGAAYNAGYLIGYNAAPYALWTAVGCAIGSSALKKKGLYIKKGETAPTNNANNNNNTVTFTGNAQRYSAPQQPASAAKPQYDNYKPQQYSSNSQQQYSARPQSAAPKFCTRCGSQLTAGSSFCSNCGADTTK